MLHLSYYKGGENMDLNYFDELLQELKEEETFDVEGGTPWVTLFVFGC